MIQQVRFLVVNAGHAEHVGSVALASAASFNADHIALFINVWLAIWGLLVILRPYFAKQEDEAKADIKGDASDVRQAVKADL